MCSVHVSKLRKRDKGNPNARPIPAEKLVPACQHEVQDDMIVTTRCGGVAGKDADRFAAQVGRATGLLTELLVADHRHPDPVRNDRFRNELEAVADPLGMINSTRMSARRGQRQLHVKSRPIARNRSTNSIAICHIPRGRSRSITIAAFSAIAAYVRAPTSSRSRSSATRAKAIKRGSVSISISS